MRARRTIFITLIFLLALTGCNLPLLPGANAPGGTPFYRPPSLAETPPEPVSTSTAPGPAGQPSPVVTCKNNLTFLNDLTIPDGTIVGPESTLDKRWEVENSGNCNWDERYRIRLIAGSDLGAQTEQALFPARSGSRAEIRIVFKAPEEPGSYRSAWQAHDPQGEPFGDPFFLDIVVQ